MIAAPGAIALFVPRQLWALQDTMDESDWFADTGAALFMDVCHDISPGLSSRSRTRGSLFLDEVDASHAEGDRSRCF